MKAKFKVGDKVKILDGSEIRNYCGGWVSRMEKYIGKYATVAEIDKKGGDARIGYRFKEYCFLWDERGLAPAKSETIIIYRKDNEVVALDKGTGKKGIAKCSPEDEFDFMIGAKLAFERLTTERKVPPVYFTGKVVCVETDTLNFTKGKIYEFKDGFVISDKGVRLPLCFQAVRDIYDLNSKFKSQFIEIVE